VTLPDPPILVVTDRKQCPESLESRARALFEGGCRWLSLREKDLAAAERRTLLQRLIAIGGTFGATVGVHDDLAAALAFRCALHLPASADLTGARHALGPEILIGRSCHDAAEIAAAAAEGADYATLGPIFASASKPGYRRSLGPADLAAIAAGARLPVLALGGVTEATLPSLTGLGFAGIAIMGEAMRIRDPADWFGRVAGTIKI
jgi:thiamine-phosphate pyrophosphorylase